MKKLFRIGIDFDCQSIGNGYAGINTKHKECFVLADDAIDASNKLNKQLIRKAPDNISKILLHEPEEIEFSDFTDSDDSFIS